LLAYSVLRSSGGFKWMLPFQSMIFITFGITFVFKFLVASEASRRLNDDHRSGALELLLVTPLSVRKIIAGQREALRRMFLAPILLIEFMLLGIWLMYNFLSPRVNDQGEIFVIIVGNMAVLVTDFVALSRVGMWMGLRSRYHHRAVIQTLTRILVVPWLLYFVLGIAGFFHLRSGVPLFTVWFGLGIVNDLIWGRLAELRLLAMFRKVASEGLARKAGRRADATMEYSNA
jgi:ABC-type Na+ efflux pump permease subunit